MGRGLPRKLAAILYADVAGYSRLTGVDEDSTHLRLREYLDLVAATIETHRGQVMHYAGDAVLARFSAAVDALSSAVEIQSEVEKRNSDLPDERKVRFRIGVNLGDVIEDRGDIYGDGVNVAARLESLAEPGGICISESVYTIIGNNSSWTTEFIGEQSVKNIARPVRAYRVLLEKNGSMLAPATEKPVPEITDKPSIAVLPFDNMSADPEQDYFSDGLTEDIITALSRFHSLFVIARNSTFAFKGRSVNVREIGEQLGVRYVIEGSVRKAGNRIRVTAQLIDAQSGAHLWAKKYDRDLDDIFAVQDEVTRSIVASLPERVGAADLERVKRKPTEQMASYEFFLRGRELHHVGTKEANLEGTRYLEKVVELDPNFAQAWAWLSCIIGQAWIRNYREDKGALWDRCLYAAKKSLELDEEDSECHRILTEIYLFQRRYDQAEYHNERGLSLNPNDPRLVVQRGYLLAYLGKAEEGLDWINKVLRLDPFHPENYYANHGIVLHAARRYAEAVSVFKRVPALQLTHHAYLASCHAHLGEEALAKENVQRILELDPDFTIEQYADTLRYKQPADLEHYLEGLRKAGLPER